MILNYLVEVVWLLISWCYAHSLNMKYVWVVFLCAQLVVRTHWTKPAHAFTLFVSSFPLQSISFLSAAPIMLVGLCSILTIALSFPVSGKCSFTEQDDVMKRELVLVSGDLIWVLVLSVTVWVGLDLLFHL